MGRRPIGDKAMTAAERQQRMRQRREDEANSLRSEIQVLKDAFSPTSGRRTRIEMPPGEAEDLTNAVMDEAINFHEQFQDVFLPKYRAWRSLKPPPPKEARTRMEANLRLMADHFLACCPSVQDRLAAKDAVIAELEEQRVARITELKTSRADADREWLAECIQHWPEGTRFFVAKKLMEGLDHGPINKWGTELRLIVNMINSLPDERRITLIVKSDKGLADFVRALRPADRKRLAGALANRPSRR
jgi:hypothetical protein